MKKILSIILAIVLTMSTAVCAFAADKTVELGKAAAITVAPGDTQCVYFKPAKSGVYTVEVKLTSTGEADISGYTEDGSSLFWSYVYDESEYYDESVKSIKDDFVAEKGSKVEICISAYREDENNDNVKVSVLIYESKVKSVVLGENTLYGEAAVYKFTADKTGLYNFRSSAGKADPCIDIYGADGEVAFGDDNGYKDNYNFDLTTKLEKGKTYLVYIDFYTDGEAAAPAKSFKMTISFDKKIDLEKIQFSNNYFAEEMGEDDLLEIGAGGFWFDSLIVTPTGAIPTAGIKVTSSNEKVASVYYDETTGEIEIEGLRPGTAVITATSANGKTDTMNVKVVSRFVIFFRSLFGKIRALFEILFTPAVWF